MKSKLITASAVAFPLTLRGVVDCAALYIQDIDIPKISSHCDDRDAVLNLLFYPQNKVKQ